MGEPRVRETSLSVTAVPTVGTDDAAFDTLLGVHTAGLSDRNII